MKNLLLICMVLMASISIQAQSSKLKKADKLFNGIEYIDAIKIYEQVAESGYESPDLFRKLGDAFYFNGDYVQATKWYDKLFVLEPDQSPEYLFRQGQSLKSIGNVTKANELLSKYYKTNGLKYDALNLKMLDNSAKYTIKKEDFNTSNSDYPAFMNASDLYVISASSKGVVNPWTKENASDIFSVSDNSLQKVEGNINTKYNEGSLVLTKDGNTMYFTRNDFTNQKIGKDSYRISRLKLYRTKKENESWGKAEELSFNSSEYSVGHPALSNDEKTLYFVSDMPGGKGGTDIYSLSILDDGSFGSPMNLAKLNTIGNEMFPFIASDNTMYFSSNGLPGMGGLDIFSSAKTNATYETVKNLGSPINSAFDDFAFMVSEKGKGYFGSNREVSNDDVYSFNTLPCKVNLEGVVKDSKTGELLSNAVISLIDNKNKIVDKKEIGTIGTFSIANINCDAIEKIRVEKSDYQTVEMALPKASANGKVYKEVLMDIINLPTDKGTDIAKLLNPIYFDLDKSDIRKDAEIELQKVIAIMKQYPALKIDVNSHTDSRANANYNLSLSERRAKSTVEYITKFGIQMDRLTGTGYGETKLINKCSDGVSCTDDEHQANRRSEFIIR